MCEVGTWPPRGQVLALSPHPDDIALSCGGSIQRVPSYRLTILTCFTVSVWAPYASREHRTRSEIRALRIDEDHRYAGMLGAGLKTLPLPDITVRCPEGDWMSGNTSGDPITTTLHASLLTAMRDLDYDTLLCPLGIGGNIDHCLIREFALSFASDKCGIVLYEDQPYAAKMRSPEATERFARTTASNLHPVVVDITNSWPSKRAGILTYTSQVKSQHLREIDTYAKRLAVTPGRRMERLWIAL